MTLVELNSSELYRIISTLRWRQGVLDNQPVSKMIEDIIDGSQYLIDKLEDSYAKALEEEKKKKK